MATKKESLLLLKQREVEVFATRGEMSLVVGGKKIISGFVYLKLYPDERPGWIIADLVWPKGVNTSRKPLWCFVSPYGEAFPI